MMKYLSAIIAAASLSISALSAQSIVITGIIDGDLSGGNPKAIELYVSGEVDLSAYTMERSSNGGTFGSSFSLTGTYTDTFVYLVGNSNGGETQFDAVFGTAGIYANRAYIGSTVNGNGNDAYRLMSGSTVIDQVAPQSSDNIYLDSYMYRISGTGPDGGWVESNWSIPGNSTLDGMDATQTRAATPFGTYSVPEPSTYAALAGVMMLGLVALRRRRV